MAISKIKLGDGAATPLRDAASLHYIGHVESGISEISNVWTSTADSGILASIKVNDVVTQGDNNTNFVCKTSSISEGTCIATYDKLSEVAAEPPIQSITANGTEVTVTNYVANIPAATTTSAGTPGFGVVKTGDNITNESGVISVAAASTSTKGVVQLIDSVRSSGAAADRVPTEAAVSAAIAELPQAMIFRGTLGTGGTITSLTPAAASTCGDTYKVITAGTYDTQYAEIGDMFICAQETDNTDPEEPVITYKWVLIPSGDVPAGTVTSVGVATGANSNLTIATGIGDGDDPITASGTITVGVADGHAIPASTDITTWTATSTEVAAYSKTNTVVTGVEASTSATGNVLLLEIDNEDSEQLNVKYLHANTNSTAVFKPVTP